MSFFGEESAGPRRRRGSSRGSSVMASSSPDIHAGPSSAQAQMIPSSSLPHQPLSIPRRSSLRSPSIRSSSPAASSDAGPSAPPIRRRSVQFEDNDEGRRLASHSRSQPVSRSHSQSRSYARPRSRSMSSSPALPGTFRAHRPNASTMHPRTWKYHAGPAIEHGETLQRIEDHDLSLHLWRAHSLMQKLRARVPATEEQETPSVPPFPGPQTTWNGSEAGRRHREGFVQGLRGWTAWPLRVEHCPLPEEGQGGLLRGLVIENEEGAEETMGRGRTRERPDERLREVVLGTAMRIAKERLRRRGIGVESWAKKSKKEKEKGNVGDDDQEPVTVANEELQKEREPSEERGSSGEESEYTNARSIVSETSSIHTTRDSGQDGRQMEEQTEGEEVEEGQDGHQGIEGDEHEGIDEDEDMISDSGYMKPTILADDDRARRLLQPSVNSVMAKLDNLLSAIAYSSDPRAPYFPNCARSRDAASAAGSTQDAGAEQQDKPDDETTSQTQPGPSTNTGQPHRQPRGRKNARTPARLARSRSRSNRPTRGKLRDWREILGLATMTGWDDEVIKRTAHRCEALFGGRIEFRTLHEEGDNLAGKQPQPQFTEEGEERIVGSGHQEAVEMDPRDEMVGGVHVDGFLKPFDPRSAWKASWKKGKAERDAERKEKGKGKGKEREIPGGGGEDMEEDIEEDMEEDMGPRKKKVKVDE